MTRGISRRAVLRGIGQSAAIGTLVAALPRHAGAAQAAPAGATAPAKVTYCLTMLYPSGDGLKFDGDAFRDRHMAVLKGAYGDSVERIELRVSAPAADGAPPPPLLAALNVWIRDVGKFVTGASGHAKEISADMAGITASKPMAQFDKVVAGLGAARNSVQLNTTCLSLIFPVKKDAANNDATWDSKGFAETYLPKLIAAYGPEAVQRIEVVQGATGSGGGPLLLLGAVNTYVADEAKFTAAGATDALKALAGDETKYYSAPPFPSLMKVYAIG